MKALRRLVANRVVGRARIGTWGGSCGGLLKEPTSRLAEDRRVCRRFEDSLGGKAGGEAPAERTPGRRGAAPSEREPPSTRRRPPRAPWFRGERRDLGAALLLAVAAFGVYNANLRVIALGDSRPARYLPFALLSSGSLTLERFEEQVVADLPDQYWVAEIDGRLVSLYPLVTPLLVTPLYVGATLYLQATGWEPKTLGFVAALMEKLAASAVAALSVALLYLWLRRSAPRRDALLLAIAYAFATNTWATSAQALWQHGPGQLLLVVALLAATGERTPGRLLLAGACCGLLAANRPPDLVLAAAVVLAVALRERRLPLVFALPAAAIMALVLAYHLALFGHPFGGYALLGVSSRFFSFPLGPGIAGLLASPGKGLFVFSPFLLFLLGRPFVAGRPQDRALTVLLALGAAAQVLLYARTDWRGGSCYGPRFLVNLMPILVWLLVPVVARLRAAGRAGFAVALAASAAIQAIGAFYYPAGRSDEILLRSFAAPWEIGNAQFLLELRNGPAPL